VRAQRARQAPEPQPPTAASYPGLPEERTPTGLVITIAVGMALAVPRIRLRLSVPRCKPPGQIPGHAAADADAATR